MPKGKVGVAFVFPPKAKDSLYDDTFSVPDLYSWTRSCLDLCWELHEWKMEGREQEMNYKVALEEPVAVGIYVAVVVKGSSLQVHRMQHRVCLCAHSNHAHFRNT